MASNDDVQESVLPYFFAGIWGMAGGIPLALGSHPPAEGLLAMAGQFLLFHAPAVMAVASQRRFGGVYKRAAIALLLAGSCIFSGEMVVHTYTHSQVPLMAPIGGGMTILGWLCAAIGAIRTQKT